MGRSVALSTIREDIRQRCDLPTFSATTYVTTAAVNRMINTSLQGLYSLLMQAWGEGYFTTSTTLTTSAGAGTTSLPTDFLKLINLLWVRGTDDVVTISEAQHDERLLTQWSARTWTAPKYRLRHSTLQWVPPPSAVYNLVIEYVYAAPDLSADDDPFDAGPGWDEWVVLDVCRKIRQREEKDATEFQAERERVEANILVLSPQRSETSNRVIRDLSETTLGVRELRDRMWRDG